MTLWWIAAALPGWVAAGALVALAVGRTVRIRDCNDNNDLTAIADAVRED